MQMLTVKIPSPGVAVGAGVQSTVAFVNLGSYYAIGLPVGVLIGYVAHLQVTVCKNYLVKIS